MPVIRPFLLAFLVLFVTGCSESDSPTDAGAGDQEEDPVAVEFADSDLAQAIREALSISADTLYEHQLREITELHARKRGRRELSPGPVSRSCTSCGTRSRS